MVLNVPEGVRGMIHKKLDVLEPEDRRVLQCASIERGRSSCLRFSRHCWRPMNWLPPIASFGNVEIS
jgi:hypothetical protein